MFTSSYGSSVFPHVTRAPTEFFFIQICFLSRPGCVGFNGLRRKFPRRVKFRHNGTTSQTNFRGSAEGTTILEGPGACHQENFAKLHLKIRIVVHSGSRFWTILFLHFFIFRVWGCGHGTVASPLRTLVCVETVWPETNVIGFVFVAKNYSKLTQFFPKQSEAQKRNKCLSYLCNWKLNAASASDIFRIMYIFSKFPTFRLLTVTMLLSWFSLYSL